MTCCRSIAFWNTAAPSFPLYLPTHLPILQFHDTNQGLAGEKLQCSDHQRPWSPSYYKSKSSTSPAVRVSGNASNLDPYDRLSLRCVGREEGSYVGYKKLGIRQESLNCFSIDLLSIDLPLPTYLPFYLSYLCDAVQLVLLPEQKS